jgi:hypothetical protein
MLNKLAHQVRDAIFNARVPLAPVYRYIETKYGTQNLTSLTDDDAQDLLQSMPALTDSLRFMADRESRVADALVERIRILRQAMTDKEKMDIDAAYNRWQSAKNSADSAQNDQYGRECNIANALWRMASALETKILAEVDARLIGESENANARL